MYNPFGKKNPNTTTLETIDENIKGTFAQISRGLEDNKNLERNRQEEIKRIKEEIALVKATNSKDVNEINKWLQDTAETINNLTTENKLIIKRLADAQTLIVKKCAWKKEYFQDHLRAEQTLIDIFTEISMPKQVAPKSRLITPPED